MILVTAANGNVARQVIPILARAGLKVRGLRARSGNEKALVDLGVSEVVIGDIRDPATIRSAMNGVQSVFHVCPGGLAYWETEIGYSIIDAAIAEGVEHVVMSTLMHPIITALLQHRTKRDVEERLISSPVNWTILQPADYMQTLVPPSTFSTGVLPVAYGLGQRHSAVDLMDVAEVVCKVLVEGKPHFWARYELCGLPQAFDADVLAETASKVCGRSVAVQPVSGPEYMRIWAREEGPPIGSAHGLEDPAGRDFARRVLVAIADWYSTHDYVGNPNILTWLLGRQPTSLEEYLHRLYRQVHSAEAPC
ncbi:NmrA family NAD(P)-binding protein [Mycobacterium sp.]|uniref:NmrA family NAD(P)-binding protein n=1 Tax=Mycobacterium sp. TaxID=1785 RepID=UPI002DA62FF3|nr:NmrA family NAD(P)-binding protein [Mycobacterium sp.]